MSKPKFVFTEIGDGEQVLITLNGEEIILTNHDEDGWSGMERIRSTVEKIAQILDIKIKDKYSEDYPE